MKHYLEWEKLLAADNSFAMEVMVKLIAEDGDDHCGEYCILLG